MNKTTNSPSFVAKSAETQVKIRTGAKKKKPRKIWAQTLSHVQISCSFFFLETLFLFFPHA